MGEFGMERREEKVEASWHLLCITAVEFCSKHDLLYPCCSRRGCVGFAVPEAFLRCRSLKRSFGNSNSGEITQHDRNFTVKMHPDSRRMLVCLQYNR